MAGYRYVRPIALRPNCFHPAMSGLSEPGGCRSQPVGRRLARRFSVKRAIAARRPFWSALWRTVGMSLIRIVRDRHATCTNNWYGSRMGRNTSFSLDEHFNAFIEDEVASGRYRSASDVVRAALRLLEERETRLNALRDALVAGENSGASTPFEFDTFVSRKRAGGPHGR